MHNVAIGTGIILLFTLQPATVGNTQVIKTPPAILKENKILKENSDNKQADIADKVSEVKKLVEALPDNPKVIYKYKTRWRTRVVTLYITIPDSIYVHDYKFHSPDSQDVVRCIHDTVLLQHTIKKRGFLKRIFNQNKK